MSVQKLSSIQSESSLQGLQALVAKRRHEPFWNRRVRGVSIYLTWLLIRTPITANGVTLLSLLAGLLGAGVFALGAQWAWIAGTLLIWLSIVLDFSDGEVARFRRESSWFGDYFEESVHSVLVIAMYCGLAVGVWQRQPGNPWPFACALLAAGSMLMARNDNKLLLKSMFQHYGMERMARIAPQLSASELAPSRNATSWLSIVNLAIFDFGVYFVVLPLAAVADRMDLFLYFYGAARLLSVAYMFAQAWKLRAKYPSREEV